jgi:hypothetical protein
MEKLEMKIGRPHLIAISGKIGSGKDTFADLFIEHVKNEYGIEFENKKFAYNLKLIVSILAGISKEDAFSREGKLKYLPEWGMTVGEMQQKVGTEGIRNIIHNNAWILSLFGSYTDECNWIVTDVRFKNEAKIIKEKGGILIRLNGDPLKSKTGDDRNMLHQSEIDLDDYDGFDYIYDNIPPISNLIEFVKYIALNNIRKNEII